MKSNHYNFNVIKNVNLNQTAVLCFTCILFVLGVLTMELGRGCCFEPQNIILSQTIPHVFLNTTIYSNQINSLKVTSLSWTRGSSSRPWMPSMRSWISSARQARRLRSSARRGTRPANGWLGTRVDTVSYYTAKGNVGV